MAVLDAVRPESGLALPPSIWGFDVLKQSLGCDVWVEGGMGHLNGGLRPEAASRAKQ